MQQVSPPDIRRQRFAWFAWAVLLFNIPVILWGAYVRVSYSGDGCGAHWPFCNGQALPQNMTKPTIIEFTHRMMTSVDSILTIALVALAFWLFPKRHAVRRYAAASLVFLIIEALLGAGLVIFRLVAHDQSAGRIWYLSAHLTNTMLLLSALSVTAWLASTSFRHFRIRSASPRMLGAAFVAVLVSVTGAVTALGDTLFPASSLMEGMRRDMASESPVLLRLRVAHPAVALLGTVGIFWAALELFGTANSARGRRTGLTLIGLCCLQVLIGALNLSLLAPVWMQLTHLFMADVVWIATVLAVAESSVLASTETAKLSFSGRQPAARKPA